MKLGTRKKIIRALRMRVGKVLGRSLPPDQRAASREISRGLRRLPTSTQGQRFRSHLENLMGAGVALGIWSEADRALKDRPEPTPQQLARFLREAEVFDASSIMRSFLKSVLRKLPPFPPGKTPALTRDEQKAVIAEMRRLVSAKGLSHKAVYEKLAQKHGVHWRTIQNWVARVQREQGSEEEKQ